jgi:hypothetical protein
MKELLLRQAELDAALDLNKERNSGCAPGRAGQCAAEILEAAAVPPCVFPPGIQQNSIPAMSP